MTGWGEVLPLVVVGAVTLFGVLVVGMLAQARADREAMEARILAVVQLLVRLNTPPGQGGGSSSSFPDLDRVRLRKMSAVSFFKHPPTQGETNDEEDHPILRNPG